MTRLALHVHPGARRSALRGWRADGALQLSVTAPAEAGRANRAALELLAEALGVRVAQLRLVRGASARGKMVELDGVDADEARRRLDAALSRRAGKGSHGE
ncbi:MAG TPA: DUF167 domain-containing protein [Candidatus Sulfotelmatobacter sp.]|nr:DUF167 domain-containing protein [Candidatus Sulfotelmatobacter sp.]